MSPAPRGLAGPAAVMFAGTATSRVLGLVRNAVLALVLTVNIAGAANAFSVANKLPNVIYMLVAGGVLNAVLVPQIVRAMRKEDGGQEYVDRLLTMAGAALAALTVVLTAGATLLVSLYGARLGEWFPVAVAFAFWCIPQLFFYGLYTLLGQVLNARSSFGPYMWAPVVNNVVAIAGLVAFILVFGTSATNDAGDPAAWTAGRVALLAGTATLGVVAQALVLIVPLYRSGFRWHFRWGLRGSGLGTASRVAMWAFAGLAVGQLGYVVVSNVAAAAGTAGGDSPLVAGNAAYDNAFLVYMLPQSLITVSLVTALFTRMSANAAAGDVAKVRGDLSLGLRVVGVFTVFATVGLAVLALPVVRVVLPTVTLAEARSVAAVALAMLVGLSALGAWTLIQRVYYAYEDTRSLFFVQIPMAAIVALGALAGALLLEPRFWVPVAGLAMSVSTITGAVVAYVRLRPRLEGLDGARVVRTHARLLLAVAPAALVGWGLLHLLGVGPGEDAATPEVIAGSLLRVVVVGSVMLLLYLFGLRLLQVEELGMLTRPAGRLITALASRARTMTGGRGGGGSATPDPSPPEPGGTSVSDTATGTLELDEGTVLAGRFRLTEPLSSDLPDTTQWLGRDQVLDAPVEAYLFGGSTVPETLDAARRAALVEDPRIPRVLNVGMHEQQGYVVTERIEGTSLRDLLAAGALTPDQARAVVGEAAAALEVARRRGVHHLALRPSAVRVTQDGRVAVTGLGLDAAQLDLLPGDFWECSRADAVGLVSLLYQGLTGRPAEPVGKERDVPPPGEVAAGVPADLDALCAATLGPDDAGPRSPAEVVRELAPWPSPDLDRLRARDAGHRDSTDSTADADSTADTDGPSDTGGPGDPAADDDAPSAVDTLTRPRQAPDQAGEELGERAAAEEPGVRLWTAPVSAAVSDDARPAFADLVAVANLQAPTGSRYTPRHQRGPHHRGSDAAPDPTDTAAPGSERPSALLGTLSSAASASRHAVARSAGAAAAVTSQAARATGRGVSTAAGATKRAVVATGTAVAGAVAATGRAVARTTVATARAVSRVVVAAARFVWTVLVAVARAVWRGTVAVARAVARVARALERAANRVARTLARWAATIRRLYTHPDNPDRGKFDPAPYVLALFLGVVLFGFIWAIDVMNGDPSESDNRRPLSRITAPASPSTGAEAEAPADGGATSPDGGTADENPEPE